MRTGRSTIRFVALVVAAVPAVVVQSAGRCPPQTPDVLTLPVTVVDRHGQPVRDLSQNEFRVFAGRQELQITTFTASSSAPLTLGLLIDSSRSQQSARREEDWSAVVQLLRQSLQDKDSAFVISFTDRVALGADVSSDWLQIDRALESAANLRQGGTALYDAIYLACRRMLNKPGRKALIIVTDAYDNSSKHARQEAAAALESGTSICLIVPLVESIQPRPFGYNSEHRGFPIANYLAHETGGTVFSFSKTDEFKKEFERAGQFVAAVNLIGVRAQPVGPGHKPTKIRIECLREGTKVVGAERNLGSVP
jgi:VWFA-related protein